MTEDSILKMERDADRLVEELAILKREVGSYRGAANELEKTRVVLSGFIEATQELAQETHQLVAATKSIGGAQIKDELTLLRMNVESSVRRQTTVNLFLGGILIAILVLQIVAFRR